MGNLKQKRKEFHQRWGVEREGWIAFGTSSLFLGALCYYLMRYAVIMDNPWLFLWWIPMVLVEHCIALAFVAICRLSAVKKGERERFLDEFFALSD